MKIIRRHKLFTALVIVAFSLGLFSIRAKALTLSGTAVNEIIQIVDSHGNVLDGVHSAISGISYPNEIVQVMNSQGQILDGFGSGNVGPAVVGDVAKFTASNAVGDTGTLWPPTLDQLGVPMNNNYSAGGFFAMLDQGIYQQPNAPVVFGALNEQLGGFTSPRVVKSVACISENDGSSTIASVGSDTGGPFVTLNSALSAIPDATTALNDTTKTVIAQIVVPANAQANTTSKLYLNSTAGLAATDTVSTGTAIYCNTPSTVQANDELIVGGGLDQTEASFTVPINTITAPFLPAVNAGKELAAWSLPITTAAQAFYTFSWPTAANGGFIMSDVSDGNLGVPFENQAAFGGSASLTTTTTFGNISNSGVSDLFLTWSLQGTGNTQTLSGTPTQGKGIIEDVLYNAAGGANIPAAACPNSGQNAFGYSNAAYNNHLFTDPQWGGTYQRMIRPSSGGNVDHNMYYTRNSWNSNSTLMLGITSPPSGSGTGVPWILNLFDKNGCFLKPLYYVTGGSNGQATFNWRITWSKTNPNIFYTTGQSGKIVLFGNNNSSTVSPNNLYAIHPCAVSISGQSDSECGTNTVMAVDQIFNFNTGLATGANFISTNQPTGPSLDESGGRIGVVTRPTSNTSGDYYFTTLPFTTEPNVNGGDLHTYDINTNFPSGYCLIGGEIEKIRYTGNGEKWQIEGGQGTGSPTCNTNEFDVGMQLNNDGPGGVYSQTHFYATDQNTPWLNGGGHHSWSPTIGGAPGGGYFVYSHVDGEDLFQGLTFSSTSGNVATATTTSGNFPVWPSGTHIIVTGASPSGYNGTWPTTATVGSQSNTVSFQIASNPGAGSGGILKDGFQWETHTIGLDGTGDVTHIEAVSQPSGLTMHTYWPWGSTANGGTAQDWFIQGVGFNNLTQYPTQVVTGCTYSGSAPTGTAVCTLANNLPAAWIVPSAPQGSLGASTVFTSGILDGSTTCYNGMYPITASTANTFSFQPRCTPAASSTANTGTAYVPFTDEVIKCFRGDATFGNQCFPLARTYSTQVTSDFFFEPLPNGDQEGNLIEFDSAPGTAPAPSFGKVADIKTLTPASSPPFNPALFYIYAAIAPVGTIASTGSASFSNVTLALEPASAAAVPLVYTPEGNVSANGARYVNGAPPQAVGDAIVEGGPAGAVAPLTSIASLQYNGQTGVASVSGGGTLAAGSTSFAGTVTTSAATGNVVTPGFTCAHNVVLVISDETTAGGAKVTASNTTTATYSATASDTVDYVASCR